MVNFVIGVEAMGDKDKFYSGTLYELNSEYVDYKAEIEFNELSQCIVKIYGVAKDWIHKLENCDDNYAIVRLSNGECFSIFYFYVKCKSSSIAFQDGKPLHKGIELIIISSNVIRGNKGFPAEHRFSEMFMEITDGHELIGSCPYDFKPGSIELLLYQNINIPIKISPIYVTTTLGAFRFEVLPQYYFSKLSINIGFTHRITFKPVEAIRVNDLHKILNKITHFFTLLSGETVTINKLKLIECEKSEFDPLEFIGYCNFPKEELTVLDNTGIDYTSFKRISIFKLTDFSDLEYAMNYWFEHYDALYNAQEAYGRILLDEELNVVTINQFLAAMQMIEGYTQAYSEEEQEIAEFNSQKERIILRLIDEADKTLVEKGLGFSGISFRKATTNYLLEGIKYFNEISKTAFNEKYKDLIDSIVNDRNFYTHSSKRIAAKLSFSDAMNISILCKEFYRTIILSKMGMPKSMLNHRFGHNRMMVALLKNLLDIDLRDDADLTTFDSSMEYFSDSKQ